ncbi:MAG: AraC family transcriptional regulator [Clostridia bacterium]
MQAKDTTSLFFTGRVKYTQEVSTDLHYHRQIELILVKKGRLQIDLIDSKSLILNENDMAIIKPYDVHKFVPDPSCTCFLVVLPDTATVDLSSANITTKKVSDVDEDIQKILYTHNIFSSIDKKYQKIYFYAVSQVVKSVYNVTSSQSDETNVLNYISQNYKQPLTLDGVAAACSTNRSFVSKTVNVQTGSNFNSYLNGLRISKFIEICFESNEKIPIESIAKQVGFLNMRTFYRAFADKLECSPKQYLNQIKS